MWLLWKIMLLMAWFGVCAALFSTKKNQNALSPVIFVPGLGGSQISAKLHKDTSPFFFCYKDNDWYNLWLDFNQITIPGWLLCWADNIKLHYDNNTRTTKNTVGVETRVDGWGNPDVVEWIDPSYSGKGAYFTNIGNMLVKNGYVRRKSLLGAPYDFRKGPNELKQYFVDLKKLIEDAYKRNNDTAITFISHSMGGPMTLQFLQQQATEWKMQYIKRFISLAGAFAGSVKALKVFAMGDDLDEFLVSTPIMKTVQITMPSSAWMLPSPLFWSSSEVLVETPARVYTMAQLQNYFTDIDNPSGWEMRKDTMRYTMNFGTPDVELHCIYGEGLDTIERLKYSMSNIADQNPDFIMGPGDGTINRRSLRACHSWVGHQLENITTVALSGVDHMGILKHETVLRYVKTVLDL